MTRDTYEQGIEASNKKEEILFISDTDDGLKMVNTLLYPDFLSGGKALRLRIENALKYETDPKVREKYIWLRNYFNKGVSPNNENEAFRTPIA